MPKISVIVPVYKVEHYLKECVDSILRQTFSDFQLILVDDGSPDNCPIICDEYAKKDNRVIVIHKENGGLSSARNAGIEFAMRENNSEYIAFIDSDDTVQNCFLERLISSILIGNCDLAICKFNKFHDKDLIKFDENNIVTEGDVQIVDANDLIEKLYDSNVVVAWNKLYKKKLFNNIRYPVGKIHEDDFVIHRIIGEAQSVAMISDALYNYRFRDDSIMNSEDKRLYKLYLLDIYSDRAYYYCFEQRNCPALRKFYLLGINLIVDIYKQQKNSDVFKISYNRLKKIHKFCVKEKVFKKTIGETAMFFFLPLYCLMKNIVFYKKHNSL